MALAVKRFTFEDEAAYDLTDDAVIAEDVLTLDDPATSLPWIDDNWLYCPSLDTNGDAILPHYTGPPSTMAWVIINGEYEYANDAGIEFWARWSSGRSGYFTVLMRNNDGPNVVDFKFAHDGTLTITDHEGIKANLNVLAHWPQDGTTWVRIVLSCIGTTGSARIYSAAGALVFSLACQIMQASPNLGGIRFLQTDPDTGTLRIAGGTHPPPIYYIGRAGTGKLKEIGAFRMPDTLTALSGITCLYDGSDPDGLNLNNIVLYYNLYHDGAWSGWTQIPQGGDISGVAASGGDLMRVGSALANASAYDAPPGITAIDLTYYHSAPESSAKDMGTLIVALETILNSDTTLAAYSGWWGAEPGIIGMSLPGAKKCGVWLVPNRTEEPRREDSPVAGIPSAKCYDHYIDVYCVMRVDETTARAALVGDSKLLAFTEDVITAMRGQNYGQGTRWGDVSETEYAITIPGPDKLCIANRVQVRFRSTYFES